MTISKSDLSIPIHLKYRLMTCIAYKSDLSAIGILVIFFFFYQKFSSCNYVKV